MEVVRALAPVGAEDHAHGERRPVLVRAQRAEVVRDALRQHRHDAVGEIDRIAALERLPVERRAGPDVSGDVGDRDGDDEAARVLGIGIGRGVDRVVVVLGVGRIDGDERQRAPVLARRASRTGRAASASFSAAGEKTCGIWCVSSAMRLTARSDLTEPIVSTTRAGGRPEAALAQRLDGDEVAVPALRRPCPPARDIRAPAAALLDRQRPARAVSRGAIDGEARAP